jgi:hypothetical protein
VPRTRKKNAGSSSAILCDTIIGMSGTAMPMGLTALCRYPVSASLTSGLQSRMLKFCLPICACARVCVCVCVCMLHHLNAARRTTAC